MKIKNSDLYTFIVCYYLVLRKSVILVEGKEALLEGKMMRVNKNCILT